MDEGCCVKFIVTPCTVRGSNVMLVNEMPGIYRVIYSHYFMIFHEANFPESGINVSELMRKCSLPGDLFNSLKTASQGSGSAPSLETLISQLPDQSRDSKGTSKLTRILLILPYKISCIKV